jgi:hypothetical protein
MQTYIHPPTVIPIPNQCHSSLKISRHFFSSNIFIWRHFFSFCLTRTLWKVVQNPQENRWIEDSQRKQSNSRGFTIETKIWKINIRVWYLVKFVSNFNKYLIHFQKHMVSKLKSIDLQYQHIWKKTFFLFWISFTSSGLLKCIDDAYIDTRCILFLFFTFDLF